LIFPVLSLRRPSSPRLGASWNFDFDRSRRPPMADPRSSLFLFCRIWFSCCILTPPCSRPVSPWSCRWRSCYLFCVTSGFLRCDTPFSDYQFSLGSGLICCQSQKALLKRASYWLLPLYLTVSPAFLPGTPRGTKPVSPRFVSFNEVGLLLIFPRRDHFLEPPLLPPPILLFSSRAMLGWLLATCLAFSVPS